MAEPYLFSYLAGGFEPVWIKTLPFESEAEAVAAARELMRAEAEASTERPLTLLVGRGDDEDKAQWLGSWCWAPMERWSV